MKGVKTKLLIASLTYIFISTSILVYNFSNTKYFATSEGRSIVLPLIGFIGIYKAFPEHIKNSVTFRTIIVFGIILIASTLFGLLILK